MVDDCIGPNVDAARDALKSGVVLYDSHSHMLECPVDTVLQALFNSITGEALMLENVRFHKEEEKNVPSFSKDLAKGCTIYVNDAFGTAHR